VPKVNECAFGAANFNFFHTTLSILQQAQKVGYSFSASHFHAGAWEPGNEDCPNFAHFISG
jgi:hypothetical protein